MSLSSGSFHKVTHRRSWRPAAVIALLVLFHVVANFVWLQQDGRTLYGDPGNHARVSLAIFDIVRRPGLSLPAQIIDATTFWPPFPYFLSQPLYALFGIDTDVTVFTTTIFSTLAIIFTYILGRRLIGLQRGSVGPSREATHRPARAVRWLFSRQVHRCFPTLRDRW